MKRLFKMVQFVLGCGAIAVVLDYVGEVIFLGFNHLTSMDWKIFFACIIIGLFACLSQMVYYQLYLIDYFKEGED